MKLELMGTELGGGGEAADEMFMRAFHDAKCCI
jgi:hypothetical protein